MAKTSRKQRRDDDQREKREPASRPPEPNEALHGRTAARGQENVRGKHEHRSCLDLRGRETLKPRHSREQ